MGDITIVSLEAEAWLGHGNSNFKAAPNNWSRPVSRQLLGRGNVFDHIIFERVRIVLVRLECTGHDGKPFHFLLHEITAWERGACVGAGFQQGGEVGEK